MASLTSSQPSISLVTYLCDRKLRAPVISWLKEELGVNVPSDFEDLEDEDIDTFIEDHKLKPVTKRRLLRAYREIKLQAVDSPCSRTSSTHSRSGSMVQVDEASDGSIIVAPDATDQQVNLVRLQNGTCIPIHLWRRSISFLTVREQAVSVCGISHFFRECSDVYMQNFWSEPIVHLPQDASSLARAMEMCQYLTRQEGYVEGTIVVVALGSGVYEVEGSWTNSYGHKRQKTLSVPFNNLSFVGKGEGETIVDGGFVVENGRKIHFSGLTVKISSWNGLVAFGVATEMILQNVTIEKCQNHGVGAFDGAKLVATECQFRQNGSCGVYAHRCTTTSRLTNCTFHDNKGDGVRAQSGAVVDLMGQGASVHDNEGNGLCAWDRGSINVYQPCVLNDMSHGNKDQNVTMSYGGTVQQKDRKEK